MAHLMGMRLASSLRSIRSGPDRVRIAPQAASRGLSESTVTADAPIDRAMAAKSVDPIFERPGSMVPFTGFLVRQLSHAPQIGSRVRNAGANLGGNRCNKKRNNQTVMISKLEHLVPA